ncbi:hypothetical protein DZK27_06955 [Rhodobacteraceae bacterium 63075]|nr:hypothetical protein DZK27_06955 [Rhodobacteraceae bacterium 63075]
MTIVICVAAHLGAAAPASALSLGGFIGAWSGQGEFLDTRSEAQMRVKCALEGARKAPASIALALKCASRRGARSIDIEIRKSDDGGIDSVIVDLPEARARGFSAKLSDRMITLEHPERGTLSLEKRDAGMFLSLGGVAALSGEILLD